MYPFSGCSGSTGVNGTSGFVLGSTGFVGSVGIPGVYPGTYGITGTFGVFGSVGSPGLVGSVGLFGYGFGVISVPVGGVTPSGNLGTHDPNLVYTTFRVWFSEVAIKFSLAATLVPSADTKSPCESWFDFKIYPFTTGDVTASNVVSLSLAAHFP